jgi:hypothetical protein
MEDKFIPEDNQAQTDKFKSLADIFAEKQKNKVNIKAPAYPWQDMALNIIKELNIPNFKRAAVFKVCRDLPAHKVNIAFNDTKELCKTGATWKYFFKIIDQK